jgi:hypothetical protein
VTVQDSLSFPKYILSIYVTSAPWVLVQGYVFLLIFKMMSMTVWFGLFNGLCLVPAILSLVGPEPPANKPEDGFPDLTSTKGQTSPHFLNKVSLLSTVCG